MLKLKILIRLILLIFILCFPLKVIWELKEEFLEYRRFKMISRKIATDKFKNNFLLREEEFYEDKEYKRNFKNLEELPETKN